MKQEQTEKFRALLRSFDTAVLITHGTESHFHSRPMSIVDVAENCDVWFITSRDSAKVYEIEADKRCHVVCQKGHSSCVSVSGRAVVVDDRSKIHALWQPMHRVWFPKGADDPDIVLIRFSGERGEYWDNTGLQAFVYVYQAIKAVMSGTPVEITEGKQHGLVELGKAPSGSAKPILATPMNN